MMKKQRKFLAFLLVLCMIFTIMPFSTLAAESGEATAEPVEQLSADASRGLSPQAGPRITNKDMSKATGQVTFGMSWNTSGGTSTTIRISGAMNLPTPAPNAPTDAQVQTLLSGNAVKIDCINSEVTHADRIYGLIAGTYSIGSVQGDSTSGYTCVVTVNNPAPYVSRYNTDTAAEHTLSPENQGSKTITLEYKNSAWVVKSGTAPVTYTVICQTEKYTVTYNDGEANGASFADQVYSNLLAGTATPAFTGGVNGKPVWTDHVFVGWEPSVADTVTESVTYVAMWKDDKNNNGIPDDEEDKLTVTYNDGEANGASFVDQVYSNLLPGTATPAFTGGVDGKPVWTDHVFVGWEPSVADTVTESVTYVAMWKDDKNNNGIPDDEEDKLTVTYNDGEANGASFTDQVHSNLLPGTATPAFTGGVDGKPVWTDHVFVGWEPSVADTVTESVTYVAMWKDDKNNNGIPDDEEDKLTVTYNDGEANGASFTDQVHSNLLPGTATPAFTGGVDGKPVWTDHVFVGWEPSVADTVTETVTYVAMWADDRNNNGIPDNQEETFTVTYTDGVEKEEVFKDQIYSDLLEGDLTPAFSGNIPTRKGYTFAGWKPAIAEKVTGNATYIAQWKALDAVQTGDSSSLTMWIALLGIAGLGLIAAAAVVVLSRKQRSR